MNEDIKQELSSIINNQPRERINRWLKIAIFIILSMAIVIVSWTYRDYKKDQGGMKSQLNTVIETLNIFTKNQNDIKDSITTLRYDMNYGFKKAEARDNDLKQREDIFIETLPEFQKRLIQELDKRTTKEVKDVGYIPLRAEPREPELQTLVPQVESKKKLIE